MTGNVFEFVNPAAPEQPGQLPNIPTDFWEAREELRHIRQAAHSRLRSADLVLHATLARISAMVDPGLELDTGLGPGSLNYFAAAVAPSGVGKSTGARAARSLVDVPGYLDQPAEDGKPAFLDGIAIGSGEGLAESFYGTVWREIPGAIDKQGNPRTEKVRTQVRKHAFVSVDEGEVFTKLAERSGSTLATTIRSAWPGETLGQANASEERTRIVKAGSYSLGLLVGYQPSTAAPLLADSDTGTTQRFAWVAGTDRNGPTERIPTPGPLNLRLTDEYGAPLTGTISAAVEIQEELFRRQVRLNRGEEIPDPLNSHESFMRSKMAALLTLLSGRTHIGLGDWELAGILWDTSCAVRDSLIEMAKEKKREMQRVADDAAVELAARKADVTSPEAVQVRLQRVAKVLVNSLKNAGGEMTRSKAKHALASRDRFMFDVAVEFAEAKGYVTATEYGIRLRVA
ncbi:hypothetical protein GCM10010472_10940 [Pseudonocardia halophobica]|uniref:DUF3987 domain-containing protein n=1 Tax=Pseudonocardia halophobica TaxID=29401 RepID=A0A9W6NY83_9PSEU|nr:hypothetical protein [Pseudonocardia halophobica]GLL13481.1 hypothetical protein GCM10017577_46250 [Pseudonocardia halophobica]